MSLNEEERGMGCERSGTIMDYYYWWKKGVGRQPRACAYEC